MALFFLQFWSTMMLRASIGTTTTMLLLSALLSLFLLSAEATPPSPIDEVDVDGDTFYLFEKTDMAVRRSAANVTRLGWRRM